MADMTSGSAVRCLLHVVSQIGAFQNLISAEVLLHVVSQIGKFQNLISARGRRIFGCSHDVIFGTL